MVLTATKNDRLMVQRMISQIVNGEVVLYHPFRNIYSLYRKSSGQMPQEIKAIRYFIEEKWEDTGLDKFELIDFMLHDLHIDYVEVTKPQQIIIPATIILTEAK